MSDPPTYDQHLLERLNALRKSSVELEPSKSIPISPKVATPESDLSARLKSLRNGTLSSSPSPSCPSTTLPIKAVVGKAPETLFPATPVEDPDPLRDPFNTDDKTLDELLADLGPEDQWMLNPDDPNDIQKLLDEAQNALPRDGEAHAEEAQRQDPEDVQARPDGSYLTRDLDMSSFALDDDGVADKKGAAAPGKHGDLEQESREAQDIVARMLDEVNMERANEPKDEHGNPLSENSRDEDHEGDEKGSSSLALPSAPSTLPEPITSSSSRTRKSLDFESDIAARMAALKGLSSNPLGLPSAPTFKPIDKPVKGVMKKQFTDEEVDSWCIICQDDATVKCAGCDGDLYCANCWKEGHMGPDVGLEEKRHKWIKYRKPN
ncbi:hypothetical protein LZ554_008413 [Drepanopeziza brunnea f. sp. 'monogermtubi']|nr:hypothetical protein LZ554_008413 [Drepanopeziza brunnea f. sp. 'monogermtubi']